MAVGQVIDYFVRGGEPYLRTWGMIVSRRFVCMVRRPRGSYMPGSSNPIAVSGSDHTGKQIISFDAVIHVQESPPYQRFLGAFLSSNFFFPIFPPFFSKKNRKHFPKLGNLTEGKMFGRLRIPIFEQNWKKHGNTKNCAKKKCGNLKRKVLG